MRKIIGKKNKVHYVEETTRFQMVKSHKGWLVIGASMFALGLGMLVTSRPVSADVVAASTSSIAVRAETTGASSSSAVKAETTDASSSSTVKAETTDASSSSAVKAEKTDASSSSAVKAETTSAISSSSAVKTETTSASGASDAKSAAQSATTAASGASDAKSVVQPMADNTAVLTNVTKDNFNDYFSLNGSATYNQTTGIVTITPDENDKVGNFSLKSKIDMNSSFTLTGQVNLGNKTSSQGGADGIGFAFHNGNTTDVGNAGGNLGIAGLQDAIGFKLDTWHNDNFTPQATVPGAQVSSTDSNGFGWSADPSGSEYPQFGGFVTTSNQQIQATDKNYYQRWWAETDTSSVQKLKDNDLDNNFHDFVASYDGATRVLTISYTETDGNTLTWTKEVDSSYQEMAMIISASTGGAKNLQQFKITSFDFKQAATVNVKYVDTKGNQIAQGEVTYPNGANVNGTYSTGQLEIPNYKFVRMDDGTATGSNSLPAKGTLTKDGDNGTVIYVYAPAYTQTSKTISETIKYIDQDGKEVAKGYTADPITFVTVTNPVDNTTTTYYSTKAKTATLDDNGVPTEAGWTKADSTDFAEVVNPEVDGYKVISNDAPNSDLTNVAVQTVYTNSSDLDFTVVYAKNAPTITTESKTINETIHYVYKDGSKAADDYVAKPVEFTRQVSTDAVTGEKTYGNWSADQSFDAVTSPELKGYTADKAQIDKQTVNGDSKDLEFTVTYTKNAPTITTEKKTVNETIHYVYKDGSKAADDYVAKPVEFTRQVSTDAVTGEKTYGNWSADQSFDAVTSPELKGYTADKAQIDKQTVNGDSKDLEFTVTYTKNAPTITTEKKTVNETIHYVYKDGSKAADDYVAKPVEFTRQVSTDAVTGEKTYGNWSADQSFDAVTSPELKGYTADKAQIDKQTVNGDSKDLEFTVTYTKNAPTITTEKKTVNETIHYVYKDGSKAADDYVAKPVEFTRQVSTDAVTGEKTYGNWSADQSFDAVTSPELKGYTADKAQIDKQTVNGDSKDLEFTVTYTKNAPTITTEKKTVNETIHYVYKDGSKAADDYVAKPVEFTRQVSTDAVTGEKTYGNWSADQSFDAVTSPELKGYTADKAQIDKQTVNGDSKDLEFTVTYTKNAPTITTDLKHQLTPGNPSQPSYATNNGAVNSPELPQTGESNSQSQTMSFIGILLAMFGSLLGFLGIKKRRND